MKTKEELTALKEEAETLSRKLAELTEDELKQVTGGWGFQEYEVFLSESKNGEGEKQGYNVAFSPTLRDFLDRPLSPIFS